MVIRQKPSIHIFVYSMDVPILKLILTVLLLKATIVCAGKLRIDVQQCVWRYLNQTYKRCFLFGF